VAGNGVQRQLLAAALGADTVSLSGFAVAV